jgi:aspartate aminotransferase
VLSERARELRAAGRDILDLTIGEPDLDTPRPIKEAAIEALARNLTHYTDSRGTPELRRAMAERLRRDNGIVVDADRELLMTPGGKQALYYLCASLIEPGDEVLIFEPYWVSYSNTVEFFGGRPTTVMGPSSLGFKPPVETVAAAVTPRTRFLLFSNPCNPTGAVWDRADLQALLALAIEKDLLIVVDEVYERLIYDGRPFTSLQSLPGAAGRVVTLGSFSKGHAMTGWRLGYLAGPAPLIKAAQKMQQLTATCPDSVAQAAGVVACSLDSAAMLDVYHARRNAFIAGLNRVAGWSCAPPQGAFYAFPDISGTGLDSRSVATRLLEGGVNVVPGIAYGPHCDGFVRLSFATEQHILDEAVTRISAVFGRRS